MRALPQTMAARPISTTDTKQTLAGSGALGRENEPNARRASQPNQA